MAACWLVLPLATWAASSSGVGPQAPGADSQRFPVLTDHLIVQSTESLPRLLMLPWMVIDRTTDQSFTHPQAARTPLTEEAHRLTHSAQAAMDAVFHRQSGVAHLIPLSEWEPHWDRLKPGEMIWQGTGCAACTPVGDLLRFDRAVIQQFARTARADYVWLGVTVVPLTAGPPRGASDECCREALAQDTEAILARSSALLIRIRDGEVVWQRDARRLDRDVLRRSSFPIYPPQYGPKPPGPKTDGVTTRSPRMGDPSEPSNKPIWYIYSPQERREMAVDETARMLARAFLRVHREVLR
jgi:hypothetical protein